MILNSLERKEYCQAFDRVWHEGMIYQLSAVLPTNLVDLLANYSTDRMFFVVYGSHTSTTRPITAGVPQGSVLGPLLYELSTADVPEQSEAAFATFAEDTAILASSPDYHGVVEHLQTAVDQVYKWTKKWKILLNGDKSTNITFTLDHTLTNLFD